MQKQTPTVNDLLASLNDLLSMNGKTTTLEIKNNLRAKGFWVKQAEVAQTLYALECSGTYSLYWVYGPDVDNVWYRTYFATLTDAFEAYDANPNAYGETSWLGITQPQAWSPPAPPAPPAAPPAQASATTSSGHVATAPPVTKQVAYVVYEPVETTTPKAGDWEVYIYGDQNTPHKFYEGDTTRKLARSAYAKAVGAVYLDTAVRRVR